jgi:translation initiation factor 1A
MGKKNTIGGKGYKKKKAGGTEFNKKPLEFAETDQKYALVTKMLGGCRVECKLYGGGSIENGGNSETGGNSGVGGASGMAIGVIRGAMRKKVYININDVIIVSVRDFEPDKVDVIHKYNNDEIRELIKLKEIPSNIHDDTLSGDGKTEAQIDFADSDGEEPVDNMFGADNGNDVLKNL